MILSTKNTSSHTRDLDCTSIPLENHPRAKKLIPYPINIDKLAYSPMQIENKIIIFWDK
jgi:hypothetical protein